MHSLLHASLRQRSEHLWIQTTHRDIRENIEGKRNILLKDGDDRNSVSQNEGPRPEDVTMQYRHNANAGMRQVRWPGGDLEPEPRLCGKVQVTLLHCLK